MKTRLPRNSCGKWCWVPLFAAVAFICLPGCLDTIELDLPSQSSGRLIIEGSIERSDSYHVRVAVRRTFENEDVILLPDEDPVITLMVDNIEAFSLQNNQPVTLPISAFHENYGGDLNSAFHIEVSMPDGNTYQSEPERIIESAPSGVVSSGYAVRTELNNQNNIVEADYVEAFISAPLVNDDGKKVSMRWDLSGAFEYREVPCDDNPFFMSRSCYVDVLNRKNEVNILIGSETGGDQINKLKIGEAVADYKFWSSYYFTVVQKTLSDRAAEYWSQIASSISRSGTIFDVPPGRVSTNIFNTSDVNQDVLGYFYASAIDTLRHRVPRENVGEQLHQCAHEDFPRPGHCCDCASTYGAETLIKPSYWQ